MIYGSFILAVCGWGASAWAWIALGLPAGVHPGFILAASVAITFTVTCSQTIVMPDKARMFALGVVKGIEIANAAREGDPEPTRLRAVR